MQTHLSLSPPKGWWLGALLVLGGLSCSGKGGLHSVHGKVLYRDKPLGGAVVTFHPAVVSDELTTVRPVGLTKDDGTFTLTTGQADGAPTGEYVVTFIWPGEAAPKAKKGISTELPETVDQFRGAYANQATSSFKVEIKRGINQLEPFNLK